MTTPKLTDLEKLAKEAGKILHAGYNKTHQVEYKSTIDPVTEVDRQTEEFLLKSILGKFPDHHILAEENGVVEGDNDHIWYIDPLDGTFFCRAWTRGMDKRKTYPRISGD